MYVARSRLSSPCCIIGSIGNLVGHSRVFILWMVRVTIAPPSGRVIVLVVPDMYVFQLRYVPCSSVLFLVPTSKSRGHDQSCKGSFPENDDTIAPFPVRETKHCRGETDTANGNTWEWPCPLECHKGDGRESTCGPGHAVKDFIVRRVCKCMDTLWIDAYIRVDRIAIDSQGFRLSCNIFSVTPQPSALTFNFHKYECINRPSIES